MIRFCVPLIALMIAFSGVANAKLVGRVACHPGTRQLTLKVNLKFRKRPLSVKLPPLRRFTHRKNVLSSRLTTRASSFKKRLSWQKTKLLS